jgi:enamine deaminase RidA (YjgF/YER057c/UK114 family)
VIKSNIFFGGRIISREEQQGKIMDKSTRDQIRKATQDARRLLEKHNGAKRTLIPIENKRSFLEVDANIMEHVDPVFYGGPRAAAQITLNI